jgi:hypothetical protein
LSIKTVPDENLRRGSATVYGNPAHVWPLPLENHAQVFLNERDVLAFGMNFYRTINGLFAINCSTNAVRPWLGRISYRTKGLA